MKTFLLRILIPVIIGCLIVLGGLELFIRRLPNDFKYKNTYMEKHCSDIKLLCLGPSTISMGVKPSYFDFQPAFSCAYASQSLDYDYWIFNKFIDKMDSLQFLVLDMSPRVPWYSKNMEAEANIKRYYLYYGCPYYEKKFENCFEISMSIKELFLRFFPKKGKDNLMTIDEDGYQSHHYDNVPYDEKKWNRSAKASINIIPCLNDKDASERYAKGVDYMVNIIKKCKEKNVKVILLSVPQMSIVYDYLPQDQLEISEGLADSLQKVYDNVYFLNYLKADSLFTTDDMFNPTHLNPRGAQKFTMILNDTIKKLK